MLKFWFLVTIFVLMNPKIDGNVGLVVTAIKSVLDNHFALKEPKVDVSLMVTSIFTVTDAGARRLRG